MKFIKRYLSIIFSLVIVGSAVLIPVHSAMASATWVISITDTTGTNRTNVPVIADVGVQGLIDDGYITDEFNFDLQDSLGNSIQFMPVDNTLNFIIPSLSANATVTYYLELGTASGLTQFPIILGSGGYITSTPDSPDMGWEIRYDGNVNTSVNSTLMDTGNGTKLYTVSDGTLYLDYIYSMDNPQISDNRDGTAADNITGTHDYKAQTFLTSSNGTSQYVTSVGAWFAKNGNPAATLTCYLYSTNISGFPDTLLAISDSGSVGASGWKARTFGYYELDNNTEYAIVWDLDYGFVDESNYYHIVRDTGGVGCYPDGSAFDYVALAWSLQTYDFQFYVDSAHLVSLALDDTLSSGDYVISTYVDNISGVCLSVDSVVQDSESVEGIDTFFHVTGTAFSMMNGCNYAYENYYDAGSSPMLDYKPDAMIVGDTMPDLDLADDGTITWGTNVGLIISISSVVNTLPATNIASTTATLNGNLVGMAGETSLNVFFEYGISTAYGSTTSLVAKNSTGTFAADVTGLSVNVLYHFRAVAASANATYYGLDLTFTPIEGGGVIQMGGGNARVFYNYIVSGDMLFTAEIVNTYTPYYPTQSPKEYFTIQLIDTDNTTVLAATPQQDWGDKPVSIYLNPTQAATITPRAAYSIRLQANFASNVTAQYTLVPTDWKGYDLTKLDDWCVYVALDMQTYYGGSGYVTVLTDRKLAITDSVGGYFTTGIPGIGQRRPNLFTTSQQSPAFNAGVSLLPVDNTTAYTAYVGTTISNDAAVFAVPFGLTGRDMLAGGMALAMLGVVATGTATMGGFGALGLFLISIPFLWLGTYFKIVGVQWIMILTIIFGLLAIRQFWIKTT